MKVWRVILLAVVAGFTLSGCGKKESVAQSPGDKKLKVAATIYPLADIVANIGGDKVEVVTIMPPGASPHTFEPTPETINASTGAAAIFKIGNGLDDWTEKIVSAVGGKTEAVDVSDGIDLRKFDDGSADPHYWLSLVNGQIIATNVVRVLTSIDTKNSEYYMDNLMTYIRKLDAADAEIKKMLAPIKGKSFATFHEAWFYFAQEYGLVVAAAFEPFPGRQPSPAWLAEFSDTVKKNNIKWIFSEPQFSADAISQVAKDLNVRLGVLDPEGGKGEYKGEKGYIAMMKWNAKVLLDALGQPQ